MSTFPFSKEGKFFCPIDFISFSEYMTKGEVFHG